MQLKVFVVIYINMNYSDYIVYRVQNIQVNSILSLNKFNNMDTIKVF